MLIWLAVIIVTVFLDQLTKFLVSKYMMMKWDKRQAAFSSLSDFAQESFSGIAVIKAFVKEAKELLAFKKLNIENEEANLEYTRASVLLRIFVTLFVESVVCVILGYGGYLVYLDKFDAGQLVEFIGYFTSVIWTVMAVSELIEMTSRGNASLKRIGELPVTVKLLSRFVPPKQQEKIVALIMAWIQKELENEKSRPNVRSAFIFSLSYSVIFS